MDFKRFLEEQKEKHAVLAFGRMNPPTVGHAKLVDKVKEVAKEVGGTHHVVISHSQDEKKNPLSAQDKLKHAKRFFPDTNLSTSDKEHPTFLQHAAKLHKAGVTHLHMIAGSDRVDEYKSKLAEVSGILLSLQDDVLFAEPKNSVCIAEEIKRAKELAFYCNFFYLCAYKD